MRIFLPCWGDSHIALLDKCLGMSLRWPKNNEAIEGAEWCIATDNHESLLKISKIISTIDPKALTTPLIEDHIKYDTPAVLLKCLKKVISLCLKDKKPMLMATPDYIYGEGTLDAIQLMGMYPGEVVSFAHMRVLPKILEEFVCPLYNEELVELGFRYPHSSWTDSRIDAIPGRTYHGGISWQRVTHSLISVRHRLPAPFFVNFIEDDLLFFNRNHNHVMTNTFALWDHLWPSEVIKSKRFRYLGSSDLAAMVEVTEEDANVPPINPNGKVNSDGYVNNNFHNNTCEQFIYAMRY